MTEPPPWHQEHLMQQLANAFKSHLVAYYGIIALRVAGNSALEDSDTPRYSCFVFSGSMGEGGFRGLPIPTACPGVGGLDSVIHLP